MPKYSALTTPAKTAMIIIADPSFFTIFNRFSNQHTSGFAIKAINHPMTNGIKNHNNFIPMPINKIVPIRLNARLTITFQYGRVSSIYSTSVSFRKFFSTNSQISSLPCFDTDENGMICVPGTRSSPCLIIFTCFAT